MIPIVDIVICAILAIAVIFGLVKGFFKCILRFLLAVVALVAAIAVASMLVTEVEFVAEFATGISGSLVESFNGMGFNVAATDEAAIDAALVAMGLPEGSGLGATIISMLPADLAAETTLAVFLADTIGNIAVTAVVAIVLYIVFRIVLSFVGKLLQLTHKDVIMKMIDKILGVVWCVLFAAVIIFLLLGAVTTFAGEMIPAEMLQGPVVSYLQELNPFTALFEGLMQAPPAA